MTTLRDAYIAYQNNTSPTANLGPWLEIIAETAPHLLDIDARLGTTITANMQAANERPGFADMAIATIADITHNLEQATALVRAAQGESATVPVTEVA